MVLLVLAVVLKSTGSSSGLLLLSPILKSPTGPRKPLLIPGQPPKPSLEQQEMNRTIRTEHTVLPSNFLVLAMNSYNFLSGEPSRWPAPSSFSAHLLEEKISFGLGRGLGEILGK